MEYTHTHKYKYTNRIHKNVNTKNANTQNKVLSWRRQRGDWRRPPSLSPHSYGHLPLHIIIIVFNQTFTIPRPLLNNFFRALVRKVDDLDNKMHSTEKMQSQVFPWYRVSQGKINCGASSEPDFIRNYFLWRRMFSFFDNRDKCRKTGFLRQKYTILLIFNYIDYSIN